MERIAEPLLERIVEPLLLWYDRKRRNLPWREETAGTKEAHAYRVWVSEIMLQQTRVEAVKPYFSRFMKELPTIADLAACPQDRLMKLWEGLGYYSRARNLQKAARLVEEVYDSHMPDTFEGLITLPGIGSYTAGAIASIAYDRAVPAVDGNVLRVLARLREDGRDIAKPGTKKAVETELRPVVPKEAPGRFNQALMELGATICGPGGVPHCPDCPLLDMCAASSHHSVSDYPVKKKAAKRKVEQKTILVITDGERVALKKRKEVGLLAGLYEFPTAPGHLNGEEAIAEAERRYCFLTLKVEKLGAKKHVFTHIEWDMTGYYIRIAPPEGTRPDGLIFVDIEEAKHSYPIPTAYASYAGRLAIRSGYEAVHEDGSYANR